MGPCVTHLDGVPVGFGAHCPYCASSATGPSYVLVDELLSERARHWLAGDAGSKVGGPARGKRINDRDGTRRIGLRPCDPRHGRQRGSARCKMEKISAGKFHSALPEYGRRSAFRHHSALMLAPRITFAHFAVSSAMSFLKSVGEPLNTVPPCSTSRALIMGSARYEIAHSWDVRQCLQADRRGHCQGSYLARADVLNRCAYAGEKNLHLPT